MTIEERVLHYTRRNSYGRLIFPHCVRAHIDEIMLYAPWALSATELNNIMLTSGATALMIANTTTG